MIKPNDPRQLVLDLIPRSTCSVQMAAVVEDKYGYIIGWGWNHSGPTGYGLCAERHALRRCNKERAWEGTIYVAGKWNGRDTIVHAKPCEECQRVIDKNYMLVRYRAKNGEWV